MKKRIQRIESSDFANLIDIALCDKIKKEKVKEYENKYNCKIDKILYKPTWKDPEHIALCITSDKKYLITCKPAYQNSLITILESVKIDPNDIIIDKREYKKQDLSIDQLKDLLLS
jgi:hypothetical protein